MEARNHPYDNFPWGQLFGGSYLQDNPLEGANSGGMGSFLWGRLNSGAIVREVISHGAIVPEAVIRGAIFVEGNCPDSQLQDKAATTFTKLTC